MSQSIKQCWKCDKPTNSHHDRLWVYTPMGRIVVDLVTCHACYKDMDADEYTQYKKNALVRIKREAMEQYEEVQGSSGVREAAMPPEGGLPNE
jgi:hypothetical protein